MSSSARQGRRLLTGQHEVGISAVCSTYGTHVHVSQPATRSWALSHRSFRCQLLNTSEHGGGGGPLGRTHLFLWEDFGRGAGFFWSWEVRRSATLHVFGLCNPVRKVPLGNVADSAWALGLCPWWQLTHLLLKGKFTQSLRWAETVFVFNWTELAYEPPFRPMAETT